MKNGIKGYEGRRKSRSARGLKLRSTAKMSSRSRLVKKLLGKTTWYRRSRNYKLEENNAKTGSRKGAKKTTNEEQIKEYSKHGELATMRELTQRLVPTIGFGIKVVERAGTALKHQYPTTTLWDGNKCGRQDCTTCEQGAEKISNCTKASLVYENVCQACNPGAGTDKELTEVRSDVPSLYVGETSRSVYERSREHWGAWRSRKDDSHILRHEETVHEGAANPKFMMRIVKHYRSALSRQIGEAVRIRRRGGAGCILNNKAEYNRCKIPRLVLEEEDDEQTLRNEEQDRQQALKWLEDCEHAWSDQKTEEREIEIRIARRRLQKIEKKVESRKRLKAPKERAGRGKKRKYYLEHENWGVDTIVEKEQENAPPAAPPAIQSEEQPPKEPRPVNSRSRQAKMSEFGAPGKVKPVLAGEKFFVLAITFTPLLQFTNGFRV